MQPGASAHICKHASTVATPLCFCPISLFPGARAPTVGPLNVFEMQRFSAPGDKDADDVEVVVYPASEGAVEGRIGRMQSVLA